MQFLHNTSLKNCFSCAKLKCVQNLQILLNESISRKEQDLFLILFIYILEKFSKLVFFVTFCLIFLFRLESAGLSVTLSLSPPENYEKKSCKSNLMPPIHSRPRHSLFRVSDRDWRRQVSLACMYIRTLVMPHGPPSQV